MVSAKAEKQLIIFSLALLGLLLVMAKASIALAQVAYFDQVGLIETTDLGLLHLAGLTFSPAANAFFILPLPLAGPPRPLNLVTLSLFEQESSRLDLAVSGVDPLAMAFDSRANRLLLFEAAANSLVEIKAGPTGALDPGALTRIEATQFGLGLPQGMTFDPATGHLFILDGSAARIIRIEPDSTPGLDSAAALQQGQPSSVNLPAEVADPRGLAFNPANGHLYLLASAGQTLVELTQAGQLVARYDLSAFHLLAPQGLVFAPSRDNTDDPALSHLYLADSGRIVEFSFARPEALLTPLAVMVRASLVKTTRTSRFSTPSPDPSGIAYLPTTNTLMISDGEVDEMPQLFRGKNLFETSLSGRLLHTFRTLPFSEEPTGVAYNPSNHHLFISDDTDDTGKRVYELDPGADGRYNTKDDRVTWISTTAFRNFDPEGIAFDQWQGHLYVVDGSGEEVYQVRPGANGRFDGVPPRGDDIVTHFDATRLGMQDPEGIEFNPDNGHLYILSGKNKMIAEATTSGTLVRLIDISVINAPAAAGLAYAPASNRLGEKHLYVVDRAVDNNTNPNENDGKMYELSFPALSNPPSGLVITGPPTGVVNKKYIFTATVSPTTTTKPLSYIWQVTGQGSETHTGGLSDNITFTWRTLGSQIVTVTASNGSGTPVEATSTILIVAPAEELQQIYLPLLVKDR